MSNWEEIRNEWETSDITFKDLAEKHGVKDSTIRSRKNREKWQRNNEPKKAQRATQRKQNVATRKAEKEVFVESDDLTDKQRLFCIYYIKYFSAIKAYQKAYECSYIAAHSNAHRMMANDGIKTEINRMKKQVADGLMIDASIVLQKYIDIALADITDFIEFGTEEREERDGDGDVIYDMAGNPVTYLANYVRFKEHDEIDGTIITEVKQGKDGVSVRLADKMKALDMLAKYTDLIPDHFKRQLETERLKIAHAKAFGTDDPEEYEDDGFNEALDATTSEVWADDATEGES